MRIQLMVAGLTWGSFRFAAHAVAAISWISRLATRPTISNAGAGSFTSLARPDTVVQRILLLGGGGVGDDYAGKSFRLAGFD